MTTIFKNMVLQTGEELDSWREVYDEHCEINNIEFDEIDYFNWIYKMNDEWDYEDIMIELDTLNDKPLNIVVLANLGLWDGIRNGYRIMRNVMISETMKLYDEDYGHWYYDKKNFHCKAYHHDGTNYYTFKIITGSVYDMVSIVATVSAI